MMQPSVDVGQLRPGVNREALRAELEATPLHQRYDAAIDATLKVLESMPDSDWTLGASFYGHGFYTVVDLFHTPAEHLAEHTSDL